MVVGVTGKYCAGKNAVSQILEGQGYRPIDVDRLGHRALEEKRERVIERFGAGIVDADGRIDRRALGAIVFADPKALRTLEETIHPAMVGYVREEIEGGEGRGFVINAAILFHMGLHPLCDRILWVDAPFFLRLRRALRRDKLPVHQILRRMWSQRKLSPQPYRNLVDIYTVRNSGNIQKLSASVLGLLETG